MKYIRANQHFADKPADDARGEYAGEQTGYDDAYVASLFSGRENWEAIGTKICGIMEQIPVMSEAPPYDVDVGGRTYGDEREYQQGKFVRIIFFRR